MSDKNSFAKAMKITKELEEKGLKIKDNIVYICLIQYSETGNVEFDAYYDEDEFIKLIKFNPSSNELIINKKAFKDIDNNSAVSLISDLLLIIDVRINNVNLVRASIF